MPSHAHTTTPTSHVPSHHHKLPPPQPHIDSLPPPQPHTFTPSHLHSPDVTVEFSQSSYTANEGDRFVLLEISKNGISQRDVFVDVVLRDLTARGGSASLQVLLHILVSILSLSHHPPFFPLSITFLFRAHYILCPLPPQVGWTMVHSPPLKLP